MPEIELADFCKNCQRRHIEKKGYKVDKNGNRIKKWAVACKGIQKKLFDNCRYNEETNKTEVGLYDLRADFTDKELENMPKNAMAKLQYSNNILLWAKDMLGWTPYNPNRRWYQYYQKEFLMCTAQYKVGRFSRRLGKTEMIVVKAPHFCDTFTGANPKALIIVPFQNLSDEIFNRLKAMLESENSVFSGKIDSRKKPFQEVSWERPQYGDKTYIRGFTTGANTGGGATSLRGQKADILFLDESAYLHPSDYGAIIPLLEERKSMELWSFSTPSALENNFKKWCLNDPIYKDFHYPYEVLRPIYTEEEFEEKVQSYKRTLGYIQYKLEFDAEFYEDNNKVFAEQDIKAAGKDYNYYKKYTEVPNYERKKFYIGVDWNSWKNGINIAVLSYDTHTGMVETVAKRLISEDTKLSMKYDKIQTEGIYQVLKIFEDFNVNGLAVDSGYGSLHSEVLLSALEEKGKAKKLKVVDFYGVTETIHPLTEEKIRQRNKPLLVHLLRERLESRRFIYSTKEEGDLANAELNKVNFPFQAQNYIIEKFDMKGLPIFSGKVDHYLDAVMLANYFIASDTENLFTIDVNFSIFSKNQNEINIKLDNLLKKFSHKRSNNDYLDEDSFLQGTFTKPKKNNKLSTSPFFAKNRATRTLLSKRKNPLYK